MKSTRHNIIALAFGWAVIGIILYIVFTLILPPALIPFIGEGPQTWALVRVVTITFLLAWCHLKWTDKKVIKSPAYI